MAKSWEEKFNTSKGNVVKQINKAFADMPEGTVMYIATPKIIDDYINQLGPGVFVDTKVIREDLAEENNAEKTCPVTTGIFLRIVAERAYEQFENGKSLKKITPFWRAIPENSKLAKKLSFGTEFLKRQRKFEK